MHAAIDPGTNSPGWALFHNQQLIAAGHVTFPESWRAKPDGQRWADVAWEVLCRLHGAADEYAVKHGIDYRDTKLAQFTFERPQWYSHSKSKGDPNQLAGIAGVAAALSGMLYQKYGGVLGITSPHPDEWIGQLSKVCPVCDGRKTKTVKGKRVRFECPQCNGSAWGTPRGRYIKARLLTHELLVCPDQNDAIDAVGIGLWREGRLQPRSVFSNGNDGR